MKEDKTLTCCECGNEFVFTASEQEFYEEKGFTFVNSSLQGWEKLYNFASGAVKLIA